MIFRKFGKKINQKIAKTRVNEILITSPLTLQKICMSLLANLGGGPRAPGVGKNQTNLKIFKKLQKLF